MKRELAYILLALITVTSAYGQEEKIHTNRGNKALETGDYEKARESYQKALEENPDYKEANFNLGNTYQMEARALLENASQTEDQEKQQEILTEVKELSASAATAFEKVSSQSSDDSEINKAQYNLGNSHIMTGEVDKSIESYKEALRRNPADEDARYNLAYAQHLKKEQEQQEQEQEQDQQEQEQEQEQDQQEKDNQNKDQQDQQDQQNQQEKQQQQQQQMSKEEAEKMLEALMRQEKDLQEKLNKKKRKGERVKIEKDW
ncbi:MAG: tetratricopeptide repeat protein [Cryomorphaceae bacterium]|nr:tetratricopeptide repeat protein [Flavobacteriales bacterium]